MDFITDKTAKAIRNYDEGVLEKVEGLPDDTILHFNIDTMVVILQNSEEYRWLLPRVRFIKNKQYNYNRATEILCKQCEKTKCSCQVGKWHDPIIRDECYPLESIDDACSDTSDNSD